MKEWISPYGNDQVTLNLVEGDFGGEASKIPHHYYDYNCHFDWKEKSF
jgi:hypothetical protein